MSLGIGSYYAVLSIVTFVSQITIAVALVSIAISLRRKK